MRIRPLPAAALAVATTAPLVALAATAQADEDPPSVIQLCAATSIETVDAYLATIADTQLVRDLAPLLELTVPRDNDGLEVEADVSLQQVRDALDCDDDGDDPGDDPDDDPDDDNDGDNGGDDDDRDDDDDVTTTPPRAPAPRVVTGGVAVTG